MEFYFNKDHKLDYSGLDCFTTVKDLLKNLELFLEKNPLPCNTCEYNCCTMKWNINADNIFVSRNEDVNSLSFIKQYLKNTEEKFYIKKQTNNNCIFLDECSNCKIYNKRALTCRLFTCYVESEELTLLKDLVGHAFEIALTFEYIYKTTSHIEFGSDAYMKTNPTLFKKNYNIPVIDILKWSEVYLEENEISVFNNLIK